jgi:hypothetical protein
MPSIRTTVHADDVPARAWRSFVVEQARAVLAPGSGLSAATVRRVVQDLLDLVETDDRARGER